MIISDPIADMLTRIRNGITSRKTRVQMPASRLKTSIAAILKEEGFISDYRIAEELSHPTLEIALKWTTDQRPAIVGLRRISRPGRRRYVGKEDIPLVRNGQGVAILTTSSGVLTDGTARKRSIGGEVLCEVW